MPEINFNFTHGNLEPKPFQPSHRGFEFDDFKVEFNDHGPGQYSMTIHQGNTAITLSPKQIFELLGTIDSCLKT